MKVLNAKVMPIVSATSRFNKTWQETSPNILRENQTWNLITVTEIARTIKILQVYLNEYC